MSNSGAFILDTILNFNDTKNSQVFPHDWADKIEGNVAEDIANNENKGDFISIISRHEADSKLVKVFEENWNNLMTDEGFINELQISTEKYKVRNIATKLPANLPTMDYLSNYTHFLRSDHARFWYNNEFNFQGSFKSVLLTDTG